MIRILHDVKIDWLAKRRLFLLASAFLLLVGLGSAVGRQLIKGGSEAFNLGVDFKGGTLLTVKFKQRPTDDAIRTALAQKGIPDAQVQSTEKADEVLIKLPRQEAAEPAQTQPQATPAQGPAQGSAPRAQAQVDPGRVRAAE